jgi:MFS family permease
LLKNKFFKPIKQFSKFKVITVKRKVLSYISVNILILSVVSFLNDISSEIILPILPVFIASLGGTGIVIGLIGGLEESLSGILKVLSGFYSDKIRKRKGFIFSGYLISSISKLFLSFSAFWQQVLELRIVDRIGKGVRTAPRDAAIADSSLEKFRGRVFGFHRAFDTLGAVVGSILVLFLIFYFALSLNLIILIAAIIGFIALVPIFFLKDIKISNDLKKVVFKFKNLPRELVKYYFTTGLFSLANFSYMFYIIYVFGGSFGVDQLLLSIGLYVLFTIFYAIFSFPAGLIADKLGKKLTLTIGFSIFTLSSLIFLFSASIWNLIIGFIFYGIFNALYDGPRRAFAVDLSPINFRGTTLGTLETIISILSLFASIFAGLIFDLIAPGAIFIYSIAISLVALIMLQSVKTKPNS